MAKKTAKARAKASAKRNTTTRSSVQKPVVAVDPPRPKARSFRFRQGEQIKRTIKLPSAWQLTKSTATILWQNRTLFLGIVLVYALLSLILVQGLTSSTNSVSLRSSLDKLWSGNLGGIVSGLSVFAKLLSSSATTSSPTAGPYQLILGIITTLATVWALRQLMSGASIRLRDTYYRGMYPLIPFFLVLLVICLQLVPFIVGAKLYNTVVSGGIAPNLVEKIFWLLIFIAFAVWSLYMISASLFALYIVTLGDMAPLKALRSARNLVRRRRWIVIRKILYLPLVLLIVAAIIMLPIILLITPLAPWVLFLLSMAALVPVNAYMYNLYRELLNE